MFIVKHGDRYHGPFRDYEADLFTSRLKGTSEVIPLHVPRLPGEGASVMTFEVLENDKYRAHVDSFKVDTRHVLAGIIQGFFFARRNERVLTVREIKETWSSLFRVSRTVESLMYYAEKVVADPNAENLEALRKAFWRNRDSDDVDPHYEDRFW